MQKNKRVVWFVLLGLRWVGLPERTCSIASCTYCTLKETQHEDMWKSNIDAENNTQTHTHAHTQILLHTQLYLKSYRSMSKSRYILTLHRSFIKSRKQRKHVALNQKCAPCKQNVIRFPRDHQTIGDITLNVIPNQTYVVSKRPLHLTRLVYSSHRSHILHFYRLPTTDNRVSGYHQAECGRGGEAPETISARFPDNVVS